MAKTAWLELIELVLDQDLPYETHQERLDLLSRALLEIKTETLLRYSRKFEHDWGQVSKWPADLLREEAEALKRG